MDRSAWEQLEPWLSIRDRLPVGALFCVVMQASEHTTEHRIERLLIDQTPTLRARVRNLIRDTQSGPWLAARSATAEQTGAAVPAVITPVLAVITPVLASITTVIAAIQASFATPPEERSRSISSVPEESHLALLSSLHGLALTYLRRRTPAGQAGATGQTNEPPQ